MPTWKISVLVFIVWQSYKEVKKPGKFQANLDIGTATSPATSKILLLWNIYMYSDIYTLSPR